MMQSSKYQIKIYIFLIKYIKSVLWRVAKRLSYMQDARCLKVNVTVIIIMIINNSPITAVIRQQYSTRVF